MKTLTEGLGKPILNKYQHRFQGFIDAYTIINCNTLAYPFVEPKSSASGFTLEEWPFDKEAMLARCELVNFNKTFKECKIEMDEGKWAQCILCMYEHFDQMPDPVIDEKVKKIT